LIAKKPPIVSSLTAIPANFRLKLAASAPLMSAYLSIPPRRGALIGGISENQAL
jgi:hypothetical protein